MSVHSASRSSRTSRTSSRYDTYHINLRAEIRVEGGAYDFPGSVTISATTLSVFSMRETEDVEPQFLGVCAIPNLQFTRRIVSGQPGFPLKLQSTYPRCPIFLSAGSPGEPTSGSGVFRTPISYDEQAALGAVQTGRPLSHDGRATAPSDSDGSGQPNAEVPASWCEITLIFSTQADQERCADALLARKATEIISQTSSTKSSRTQSILPEDSEFHSMAPSTNREYYTRANYPYAERQGNGVDRSRNSCAAESQRSAAATTPRGSQADQSQKVYESARSTARHADSTRMSASSRSPRQADSTRMSASSRSPRQAESPRMSASSRSPRQAESPRMSASGRSPRQAESERSASHAHSESDRYRSVSESHMSTNGSSPRSRSNQASHASQTPRDITTGQSIKEASVPSSRQLPDWSAEHQHSRGASTQNGSRGGSRREVSAPASSRRGNSLYDALNSVRESVPSVAPSSLRNRSEASLFVRNIQKLMHHRLHVMQYLHKEMVHQAYQLEESKLLRSKIPMANMPPSAMSRVSSYSPRRTQSIPREESARLREIENRLNEVEDIHREADRDRKEAARLRQEFEEKNQAANQLKREYEEMLQGRRRERRNQEQSNASQGAARGGGGDHLVSGSSARRASRSELFSGEYGAAMMPSSSGSGGQLQPYATMPPTPKDDGDFSTTVLDRYIFGDEWNLLFPSRESDIRMNAQVDICLTCRIPRHNVFLTYVTVDNRGLRLTFEVRHDHTVMPREYIERRIHGCPFRFLLRFYELRHCFQGLGDPANGGHSYASSTIGGPVMQSYPSIYPHQQQLLLQHQPPPQLLQHQPPPQLLQHQPPPQMPPQQSVYQPLTAFAQPQGMQTSLSIMQSGPSGPIPVNTKGSLHPVLSRSHATGSDAGGSAVCYSESEPDYDKDREAKMRQLRRRTEDRLREKERSFTSARVVEPPGYLLEVQRKLQLVKSQLLEEELYGRSTIQFVEARKRQAMMLACEVSHHRSFATAMRMLEDEEQLQRAMMEVGYARQSQAYFAAHRRATALFRLMADEAAHRGTLKRLEDVERGHLVELYTSRNIRPEVVPPTSSHRTPGLSSSLSADARAALKDIQKKEARDRAYLLTEELKDRLKLIYDAECHTRDLQALQRARSGLEERLLMSLEDLVEEERLQRAGIAYDESRRRLLLASDFVVVLEAIHRDAVEVEELEAHSLILDEMVHANRLLLERRMNQRELLAQLASDEQYNRRLILHDEAEAWEVLMEIHASEMEDFYIRSLPLPEIHSEDPDLESPGRRRRQLTSPRVAKPFHYMTFHPDDMDFPPSAALAIEGILGCTINKNLEITSIQLPLPRADHADLQFQAGDMILDVAGHALHSLSHLREVLSSRTMQIQREALEEFPNVPEAERTTLPALQRYIDMLCEHHNFLVQVLRSCDIFQVIVRS